MRKSLHRYAGIESMGVKIGMHPVSWSGDRSPSAESKAILDGYLCDTRQAGFQGAELACRYSGTSAELGSLLERHGLELASGWYEGHILERDVAEEFEAITPSLSLLRDLGATCIAYADTSGRTANALFRPISERPRLNPEAWPAYGAKLTELAERMQDFGIQMAFHPFMGTIVESDDDVDTLMENSGEAVGLLFDTGQSILSGGDPVTVLDQHARRVVHVHCRDVRADVVETARARDMSLMDAVLAGVFTVPGDGAIPYEILLPTLVSHQYRGWLVVESDQDPCQAKALDVAAMSYRNLTAAATAAGMRIAS